MNKNDTIILKREHLQGNEPFGVLHKIVWIDKKNNECLIVPVAPTAAFCKALCGSETDDINKLMRVVSLDHVKLIDAPEMR